MINGDPPKLFVALLEFVETRIKTGRKTLISSDRRFFKSTTKSAGSSELITRSSGGPVAG